MIVRLNSPPPVSSTVETTEGVADATNLTGLARRAFTATDRYTLGVLDAAERGHLPAKFFEVPAAAVNGAARALVTGWHAGHVVGEVIGLSIQDNPNEVSSSTKLTQVVTASVFGAIAMFGGAALGLLSVVPRKEDSRERGLVEDI